MHYLALHTVCGGFHGDQSQLCGNTSVRVSNVSYGVNLHDRCESADQQEVEICYTYAI